MNAAVEFVLGILMDGAMDAVGSRKVPLLLRIALGAVLLICFGGVCGLVILVGADTGNIGLLLLGVLLTASLLYWIVHTVRNFRENRKGR